MIIIIIINNAENQSDINLYATPRSTPTASGIDRDWSRARGRVGGGGTTTTTTTIKYRRNDVILFLTAFARLTARMRAASP